MELMAIFENIALHLSALLEFATENRRMRHERERCENLLRILGCDSVLNSQG